MHDAVADRDRRRRNRRPSLSGDCRGAGAAAAVPEAVVTFAGTARGIETRVVPREGFELDLLRSAGLKAMSPAALRARPGAAAAQRRRRVADPVAPPAAAGDWRRRLQLGSGGLVAAMRRIPTLLLEQNAVPGFTNRHAGAVRRRGGGHLRVDASRISAGGDLSQATRSVPSSLNRPPDAPAGGAAEGFDLWGLPGRARDQHGHGGGGAAVGSPPWRAGNHASDRRARSGTRPGRVSRAPGSKPGSSRSSSPWTAR